MDNRRLLLLAIFGFSLLMIWEAWQKEHLAPVPTTTLASSAQPTASAGVPVPTVSVPNAAVPTTSSVQEAAVIADSTAAKATVKTDVLVANISAQGGDLVRLELLKYKATGNINNNFLLFDSDEQHIYEGQSGLIGSGMPNHKTLWHLVPGDYDLKQGQDAVSVTLESSIASGGTVMKTYTFHRGSYLIDVVYRIVNQGAAPLQTNVYFQITRDGKAPEAGPKPPIGGTSTFTGPAVYTNQDKYQKVSFSDIDKDKAKYATHANDGWIGLVQHYFVSAWLPKEGAAREFYIRKIGENLYSAGVIVPFQMVEPGASANLGVQLYAGPQEQDKLKKIAPGLNLVVDYGWLAVIAQPIFWVMELIHRMVGNWGWSIILLTVLIKAVFFPLSAASYKSMAKMRLVTPKMTKLKEMYGDDRARLNQEMMELYKKEKINPLGGCLPIMVQIPVFISLYWVLLGAVEMRNAPWLGWITDLSVKDPYFILPLIMGATMLIQTKLNPTPPDPMQAKIMMIMPIVFTGMFLFFPSGLVLYWVVNNTLSIAQQWQITRMIEGGKKA
ncbi:MAG: membrane protein insertase YidC [Georgfuchsia sp.]